MAGVFFNTAAVFDADGKYLEVPANTTFPIAIRDFWRSSISRPGNSGDPVFETRYGAWRYICYDRHFPKARDPGLNGAEIVFNLRHRGGTFRNLWELEQPAHAWPTLFRRRVHRVGPKNPGRSRYSTESYFCNPRGKIVAQASRDKDELVVADLNSMKSKRCARRGNSIATAGRNVGEIARTQAAGTRKRRTRTDVTRESYS